MDRVELQKSFYRPWCTEDQIERIFCPKSTDDELLRLRAQEINDNVRLYRTVLHRLRSKPENLKKVRWDFTEIFDDKLFDDYLLTVPAEFKGKSAITKGFVFSNDPSGACIQTQFGNIIVVAEGLWHFLYFMNLAHLKFSQSVPEEVKYASRTIAIRTMLLTEAQDFDMDPRGIVPMEIHQEILHHVNDQLFFIISHEYAHHFCKHLDNCSVSKRNLMSDDLSMSDAVFYNRSQQQEFEADVKAVAIPILEANKREQLLISAFFALAYFKLYETVQDYISPPFRTLKTHPDSVDRITNLYQHFRDQFSGRTEIYHDIMDMITISKNELVNDVGFNVDQYEFYGSIYLSGPNTHWRGRELIDRKDF